MKIEYNLNVYSAIQINIHFVIIGHTKSINLQIGRTLYSLRSSKQKQISIIFSSLKENKHFF